MTLKLENGDCLELMKNLPDKSIDLFICDLPFGEININWDSLIDLNEFWKQFKRLRKSKKVACIHFCSTKFGYSLIKSNEKMFKMDLCIVKGNKTGGLQSKYRPMRNHDMVYFFYEQAPKYLRDKYHKRIVPLQKSKEEIESSQENFGWSQNLEQNKKSDGKQRFSPPNPVSVLYAEKTFIRKRHHQTEKPLNIIEFFLNYWSDEGDTILDPTMGGGSVGVACRKLKRNFIGFELDEKIFKVAEERITSFTI